MPGKFPCCYRMQSVTSGRKGQQTLGCVVYNFDSVERGLATS